MYIKYGFVIYVIFSLLGKCRSGPLLSFPSNLDSLRSTVAHFVSIFRFLYVLDFYPTPSHLSCVRFLRFPAS